MAMSQVQLCVILELAVVLFQILGVLALCLTRLMPETSWAYRGRVGFIFALFGLGVAGALCGLHDSEFALFAGVTMTVLLFGVTVGGGMAGAIETNYAHGAVEHGPLV
ncbi:hypothetical protein EP7_003589 [Isosphaeraceae bacterium EP7]